MMMTEWGEAELLKLHVEAGDMVLVVMPENTDGLKLSEATNEIGNVVKMHHPDVDVFGMVQGIETKVVHPEDRRHLAEALLGPVRTLRSGWYIERDDNEIQEGPFDTIHLARTKLHAVYDESEYRVIWLEPEHRFVQP